MVYAPSSIGQNNTDYICHHGIKGQRWGVRRYQNADGSLTELGKKRYSTVTNYGKHGGVIPKGTSLYRISTVPDEKYGKNNVTYVSTNKFDNAMWQDALTAFYGEKMYSITMQTMKDIKVAPETAIGKAYVKQLKDHPWRTRWNTDDAILISGRKKEELDIGRNAYKGGVNIALQSPTGRRMINDLRSQGYDAIPDVAGKDTANDPLIFLNPNESLGKSKVMETHTTTQDDSKTNLMKTARNSYNFNKNYFKNK